jgi:trk system potassium uptake protein
MSNRKIGVIIGMGEFGVHIAKSLSSDGCEVIAVDINEKRVNVIKDFVMKAIVADAAQQQTFEQII